jgi:hypothetical protein
MACRNASHKPVDMQSMRLICLAVERFTGVVILLDRKSPLVIRSDRSTHAAHRAAPSLPAHLLRAASSSCRISGRMPLATLDLTKQSPHGLRSYDSGGNRAAARARNHITGIHGIVSWCSTNIVLVRASTRSWAATSLRASSAQTHSTPTHKHGSHTSKAHQVCVDRKAAKPGRTCCVVQQRGVAQVVRHHDTGVQAGKVQRGDRLLVEPCSRRSNMGFWRKQGCGVWENWGTGWQSPAWRPAACRTLQQDSSEHRRPMSILLQLASCHELKAPARMPHAPLTQLQQGTQYNNQCPPYPPPTRHPRFTTTCRFHYTGLVELDFVDDAHHNILPCAAC